MNATDIVQRATAALKLVDQWRAEAKRCEDKGDHSHYYAAGLLYAAAELEAVMTHGKGVSRCTR